MIKNRTHTIFLLYIISLFTKLYGPNLPPPKTLEQKTVELQTVLQASTKEELARAIATAAFNRIKELFDSTGQTNYFNANTFAVTGSNIINFEYLIVRNLTVAIEGPQVQVVKQILSSLGLAKGLKDNLLESSTFESFSQWLLTIDTKYNNTKQTIENMTEEKTGIVDTEMEQWSNIVDLLLTQNAPPKNFLEWIRSVSTSYNRGIQSLNRLYETVLSDFYTPFLEDITSLENSLKTIRAHTTIGYRILINKHINNAAPYSPDEHYNIRLSESIKNQALGWGAIADETLFVCTEIMLDAIEIVKKTWKEQDKSKLRTIQTNIDEAVINNQQEWRSKQEEIKTKITQQLPSEEGVA